MSHKLVSLAAALVSLSVLVPPLSPQPASPAPAEVFSRYCVSCHNQRLKTGGFVLDPAESAHPSSNPEQWEKVLRKLRSFAMPPTGSPRPDEATYDRLSSYLESEIDRAAAAKPNPGKLPPVHRL